MAVHALPHRRGLLPQALSHPHTASRRALLRAAPAILFLLLPLTGCSDGGAPTGLTPVHPSFAQVASAPVVNTLSDSENDGCDVNECTLREAIAFASSGATITFESGLSGGTITLTSFLSIAKYLTIAGPGADQLAVSGAEADIVFYITGGHSTISGLTIRDGLGWSNGGGGVVVSNSGTATTLENCVLENNTAGPLSYQSGGALWINSGTDVTISSCTLSGNTAPDVGQAIFQYGGSLTILNSTITGHGPGTGKDAIYKYGGTTRIDHSTITGNGVGLKLSASGSDVSVKGSIISGNTSADVYGSSTGGVTSLGYNLIGTSGTNYNVLPAFSATGDQTGVTDPGLALLALNSPGSTPTHALANGSLAIDAGVCSDIDENTVDTDQRGVTRPQGSDCDIGAYEKEVVTPQDPTAPVVNTLADHDDGSCDTSDCTLREAIAYASSGATVTFASSVAGPITLAGTPLTISADLTITGPGASSLSVSGNDASGVFVILEGATVSLSGLTITGGYDANSGGGIINHGTLTITDAVISDNEAGDSGGGVYSSGTLTITKTTISGNTCAEGGGGVFSWGGDTGSLTVIASTISGNSVTSSSGDGGGIAAYASSTRTTPHTLILNSTISGNSTTGSGGGFENWEGGAVIVMSTITANHAANSGGGVHNWNNPSWLTGTLVKGSLIWGNTSGSDTDDDVADYSDASNSFYSLGYNLVGAAGANVDFDVEFADATDQTGVGDAGLDALTINAPGMTATHALQAGSPAIDAGNCTDQTGATIVTDQRGVTRPQGDACDIGAYEAGGAPPPSGLVVNSLNDPGTGGCDATECTLREAIESSTPGAAITFSPELTGTINLIDNLQVNWNLTITGPGAEYITIDANGTAESNRRAFVVGSTASISGLTVTGGYAETGGGIVNEGTLTLSNMVVTGNQSDGDAGGIYNSNSGTLTVSQSTVSANVGLYGGGIVNSGTLVVDHSTISGNEAIYSLGGGIGGGIWATDAATTTISNSTISGNTAACRGGGIDNMKLIRIEHSTITGNATTSSTDQCMGGGMQSYAGTGQGAEIVGSIIWGNSAGGVADDLADQSDSGTFTSLGHNLIGTAGHGVDFSVEFLATGDQTAVSDTEVVLDALALNEPGTTETHGLPEGSLAIDAGTCTGLDDGTVADDQRGITRPQGSACDIGAYEKESSGEPSDPNLVFSPLPAKTYGDAPFLLDSYVTHDGGGAVTFALGAGSAGCSVSGSTVTITGAAVDPSACVIMATLAAAAPYAGDEASQSFHIGKAALTVTANNQTITYLDATPTFSVGYSTFVGSDDATALGGSLVYTFEGTGGTSYGSSTTAPTDAGTYSITPSGLISADYSLSYVAGTFTINKATPDLAFSPGMPSTGTVGDGFTPVVEADGDGATSVTSSTTGICTVNTATGYVSFDAVGTCTLTAHVAEGTNFMAVDGNPWDIAVSTAAPIIPTFTFNLSTLGTKTYGDAPFSVASYASTNSSGAITFELDAVSTGCSVTSAGMATITGAAVDPSACVIMASLAAAAPYAAAGPISQSFNIAKAATTVSISNLPASGTVGGGFTPEYDSPSDGVKSTTSSTTGICTVNGTTGAVSFIGAGTCTLVAHVAEGPNYNAAEGDPQDIAVSTAALLTPKFTFDLSRLKQPTYGDEAFSVAANRYVSTNSSGQITFGIGAGSMGCSVTEAGLVTITNAAVGEDDCVIEAALASDGTYTAAGPIAQSFNIAKAEATVSISNIPASATVDGVLTPAYSTESDGTPSVVSTTEAVCTVSEGVVTFVAAGTCTLVASVDETPDYLPVMGVPQSFGVGGAAPEFSSSCTFSVNSRNGQTDIMVNWANADPGVTSILITDGRDLTKEMAPTPTGSWTARLKGIPTGYSLWGGDGRAEINKALVEGGQCVESGQQ